MKVGTCLNCAIAAIVAFAEVARSEAIPRAQLYSPHDPLKGKRSSLTRRQTTTCAASKTPWVFAHFKVQQTELYTPQDWLSDIQLAYNTGIDGFALNVGVEAWTPTQVAAAYQAAQDSQLNFKLFISFDMSEFTDATQLLPFVTQYGLHPNQFIYSSKVFTSTLGGETTIFTNSQVGGQNTTTVNDGWQNWYKQQVSNAGYPTYFVPSFPSTSPSQVFDVFPVADGIFSLDAWSKTKQDLSNQTDIMYQAEAAEYSKSYMMPVSGAYFTHSASSNVVYRAENWDLADRWEQAISLQPDFIEILSWNGYDESDYIGPVRRPYKQPSFVQGLPHTAWLLLSQFYIQRYKTGSYPTIKKDTLIYWYRTHSNAALAIDDPLGRPSGWNSTEDAIYVVALIASSSVNLVAKTGIIQTNTTLDPGINKIKIAFVEGTVSVRLQIGGVTTAIGPPGPQINNTITTYNFNPWVGSVSAP